MLFLLLLLLVLFSNVHAADNVDEFTCKDGKVCRHNTTKLPLLGLPRPFATLYADNTGETVLSSNVRAFQPLFIFARQDLDFSNPAEAQGWYQVGPSIDDPMGWIKAQDLIEWKQSLIVAYTHPGIDDDKRNPVLMFNDKASLQTLVLEKAGSEAIADLYETLEKAPKNLPENIVSAEPNSYLDIDESFYLLPVLDFELIEDFDVETRLLQVAAALPEATAAKTDSSSNNTVEALQTTLLQRDAETLDPQAETLGIDVKFVLDITGSMQPFVDATKKGITEVATTLEKDYPFMRFGLVGYSDAVKTFNDGQLTDAATFLQAIQTIRAQGGEDFQEEMFAGVKTAIDGSWNDNSLKIIVIVGDASSHPADSSKSLTKMDENTLRDYASTNGVTILSVHLKSNDARVLAIDFPVAEQQFSTLARNEGVGDKISYVSLPVNEATRMSSFLQEWMQIFGNKAAAVRGDVKVAEIAWSAAATESAVSETSTSSEAAIAEAAIDAALVRYLGKSSTPPRDITVWVYDHDLADPSRQALDVRILLNRAELNDLILALENILKAFKRSQLTEMEFFESIQSVVASSSKKQEVNFDSAKDLKDSGLLPSWINTLPYRSQILKLNNEIFAAMSPDERAAMEQGIENRLRLYREYNENTDIWQALNARSSKDAEVFALSLEMLP